MEEHQLVLASADGHVGPPTHVYRDYLEKRLHGIFDDYYETHLWRWSPSRPESFFPSDYHRKFEGTDGYDPAVGHSITWDAGFRLKELDRMGIACEVLHPDDQSSNDPPFGSGLGTAAVDGVDYPAELIRCGARAYNRWLADFCSADAARLQGNIILGTLDDVNWCVDEIRRAYDSGLHSGVMLSLEYYLPLYHHPRYNILWETCVELNLPVDVHISKGGPKYLGEDPWVERFMWAQESAFFGQRPLWSLIFGGVLERYPTLQLVFTEFGAGWVRPLLTGLDNHFSFSWALRAPRGDHPVRLSLTPSEYWERQCYVVHSSFQSRQEVAVSSSAFAEVSIPNMVWGADIGHGEGWWPTNTAWTEDVPFADALRDLVGGLPASTVLPFLSENFFKAYPNADRQTLTKVAAEIQSPTATSLGITE